MQFFGKRAIIYVTLFLALFLCVAAECQPAASYSVSPAEDLVDNPVFGLSNLLDSKGNFFVPPEVNISQKTFVGKDESNKNLLIIWTDSKNLKALNLMSICSEGGCVDVIGLPINKPFRRQATPALAYQNKGREGLVEIVEAEIKTKVDYHIQVDQAVFEKIGEMIGPLNLCGQVLPVAEAFEETPFTQNIGCEKIIRSLANKMTEPDTLVKLPFLAYILATEVETNMGIPGILHLYKQVHRCGANNIHRVM